ncbi:MAG: CRISPR-associated helicase Cas3' [Chloroflexaceae bacterium]|nr:CRISPR-associated helicase Cas3' [Chloroflexaceae bacterium]
MIHKPFDLRPFQERVFATLMAGQSVILQAPTGAGKTRAALAPFLQNLAHMGDRLPLTCRYAVPLRVLARQFFAEYHLYGEWIDAKMNTRLCETYKQFGQEPVRIQIGEQADDPHFEAALTFCTIDQLLASALGVPYSAGGRRANLNVGAIVGSYLVFDEFHLFPYEQGSGARLTTLQLLRMTRLRATYPLVPFVLMTATFSTTLLEQLATLLDAQVISPLPEVDPLAGTDELDALNAGRERSFFLHETPLSAQAVLAAHTDSSLVVCNTVRRSQQMYQQLREQLEQEGRPTRLLLLHSRFTPDDRGWLQEQLEADLNKAAWQRERQRDVIVVGTQVMEVGLDISASRLHSEIAPASSLIQRAGRCARFAQQRGEVHVYPLDAETRTLPYKTDLCEVTLQALAEYDGRHVGFREEQGLIDAVHTTEDSAMLEQLGRTDQEIKERVVAGWSADSEQIGKIRSQLIRDVQQVSIIIHDDPKSAITERPWQWESFGLSPYLLTGAWDALDDYWGEHGNGEAWCLKPVAFESADEAGERMQVRYAWESVAQAEVSSTPMIALPSALATYDSPKTGGGLGFLLRDGGLELSNWPAYTSKPRGSDQRQRSNRGYEQESYTDHISGLLRAYQRSLLQQQLAYPARVLEAVLGLPAGSIDQAIRLAIACHDIGKLGTKWQGWCEAWQTLLAEQRGQLYAAQPGKRPFAHTDFDGSTEMYQLQRMVKSSRPNHACESAALAAYFVEETLIAAADDNKATAMLACATVAAIARHHAATSSKYGPITLVAGAVDVIRENLELVRQGQSWSYDLAHMDVKLHEDGYLAEDRMTLPTEVNVQETLLYFVLVRVLRLADQRSFDF